MRHGGEAASVMLSTLDHLVIAVRDLETATATYTALLGRAPSWHGSHPGWGTANVLFRLSNTYVELLGAVDGGPLADALRARLDQDGEGPHALAFGTADAGACAEALRARGLKAAAPLEGSGRDHASGAERRWRNVLLPLEDTRGVQLFVIEHLSPADALPPARAIGDEGSTVDGVDHAVIMTADPDAAIGFYRDQLGLRLAFDRAFPERGVRLLFFRIGGITVELAAALGERGSDGALHDRFWGISYRVADIGAARARVAAAGFDVSDVRQGHKPGTQVCTVRRKTHGVATLFIGPAAA
jgi:catechol 2,3-dioxygenase-like lactoylglutathione lyase family enzyme